jgi:O-antigen/teichoic acid export membrane protein
MPFIRLLKDLKVCTLVQRYIVGIRNASWAASEGLINPIFQLVLTPFLLHSLGKTEFGIWVLCLTFCTLGPLLTFGGSAATLNRLSELLVEKNKHNAARAFITGLLLIGVTGSITILALWFFLTSSYGLGVFGNIQELHLLFAVTGLTLLAQEFDSTCAASLKANHRFDLNAKIDICFRIVWVGTVALIANYFGNAFPCMVGSFLIIALRSVVKCCISLKILGFELRFNKLFFGQLDHRLFSIAGWFWGQTIGGVLFNAVDKFLVSTLFGLETLGSYAICSQIGQFIHGIHVSAGQVLLPWASKNAANPTVAKFLKFRRVALIAGVGCLVTPLLVAIMLPVILSFWIGPYFASENYYLALALLASYSMLSAAIPLHYILLGMGQVRLITLLNIAAGIVSSIIGFLIAPGGIIIFALSKCVYAPITWIAAKKLLNPAENLK